jgi:hypothetical protein
LPLKPAVGRWREPRPEKKEKTVSHSVVVTLIADQCIFINGKEINVHDLETIEVDDNGVITNYWPAQQNMHSDASPLVGEQSEDTSGEAPVM